MKKVREVVKNIKKIVETNMDNNRLKLIKELDKAGFRQISPIDWILEVKYGNIPAAMINVKVSKKYLKVEVKLSAYEKETSVLDVNKVSPSELEKLIYDLFKEIQDEVKQCQR